MAESRDAQTQLADQLRQSKAELRSREIEGQSATAKMRAATELSDRLSANMDRARESM